MLELVIVPSTHIDYAWRDGANSIAEATQSIDEITGSQLKMILAKGERTLVQIKRDSETVGWGVFRIDQLPNMRVLFITDLVSHNSHFEEFFAQLKDIAFRLGCIAIRCAALPAQARLYRQKLGFTPVYETLEYKL
jgi:hypothetical protein